MTLCPFHLHFPSPQKLDALCNHTTHPESRLDSKSTTKAAYKYLCWWHPSSLPHTFSSISPNLLTSTQKKFSLGTGRDRAATQMKGWLIHKFPPSFPQRHKEKLLQTSTHLNSSYYHHLGHVQAILPTMDQHANKAATNEPLPTFWTPKTGGLSPSLPRLGPDHFHLISEAL